MFTGNCEFLLIQASLVERKLSKGRSCPAFTEAEFAHKILTKYDESMSNFKMIILEQISLTIGHKGFAVFLVKP